MNRYPVIMDIEVMIQHCTRLYTFMDAARRTGFSNTANPRHDAITDDDTVILKMAIAVAMTTEGCGQSELGEKLFKCVKERADKTVWGEDIDLKGLVLMVIVVCEFSIPVPR